MQVSYDAKSSVESPQTLVLLPRHAQPVADGEPAHDTDWRLVDTPLSSLSPVADTAPRFHHQSHHYLYHQAHHPSGMQLQVRNCSQLTHVNAQGKAQMVDVGAKASTTRLARAEATVEVGEKLTRLIAANELAKGDVLTVAQLAGIMGAKRTSDLIPLCHNISLSSVKVQATLLKSEHSVRLEASVRCSGQTGVEMEALTAVSVAALTVYDMCKAVSHDICITNVRLLSKSGGKRDFQREEAAKGAIPEVE